MHEPRIGANPKPAVPILDKSPADLLFGRGPANEPELDVPESGAALGEAQAEEPAESPGPKAAAAVLEDVVRHARALAVIAQRNEAVAGVAGVESDHTSARREHVGALAHLEHVVHVVQSQTLLHAIAVEAAPIEAAQRVRSAEPEKAPRVGQDSTDPVIR